MEFIGESFDLRYSGWVREALNELTDCFTITDPCISGHPIVFASKGFLKMVGYSEGEVIGKNGRIFQGPGTDRKSVMEIREAIRQESAAQVRLLNYRKDGTHFWMLFQMCPVYNKEDGKVINFVAVNVPITRKPGNFRWGNSRTVTNLAEDRARIHELAFQYCRREVSLDLFKKSGHASLTMAISTHDDSELGIDESCQVNEREKTKASAAMNNILSVLTHYSQLTGRLVCRKRCCITGIRQLGAPLNISLSRIKQSFVLTDALLPDLPVVYASEAFLKLTGYARHEVLGQNCRFLSGNGTDPATLYQVKESIQSQKSCTVCILNYRKDGTRFWNLLHISPVRSASGKVTFFVGVQMDVDVWPKNQEPRCLSPEMRQLSVVGAVRVAVRSSSLCTGAS